MNSYDVQKFENGWRENKIFWSRMGVEVDLRDTDVLDLGCGWGTLCVDAAQRGARSVTGLDILPSLIEFATAYTQERYPALPLRFASAEIETFEPQQQFDVILSKDTFEHLTDVAGTLATMKKRLKPGGRAYVGFAPLYHSPWGDHDRRRTILRPWGIFGKLLARLPWGHLIFHSLVVRQYNKQHEQPIRSLTELNLNGVSFSEFNTCFAESGLDIVSLRTNVSTNPLARFLAVVRRFKPFEKYCTNSVYCVLKKPQDQSARPADLLIGNQHQR